MNHARVMVYPLEDGTLAAPTVEYFEFSGDSSVDEVRSLADRVAAHFPDMMSVRDAIEGLSLIF